MNVEDCNFSCSVEDKEKGNYCEIYSYLSTPTKGAVVQFKSRTHCQYCVQVILETQVLSLQKKQGNIILPVVDKLSLSPP